MKSNITSSLDSQAIRKNNSRVKIPYHKRRGGIVRSIEGELTILNAIARLNRAIAAHEDYLADNEYYGLGDDWTPSVRIADDMVVRHRPARHLFIFTKLEIRALRDALIACPIAALRFHASVRQVRQRWLRGFNRAPPVLATRPADHGLGA